MEWLGPQDQRVSRSASEACVLQAYLARTFCLAIHARLSTRCAILQPIASSSRPRHIRPRIPPVSLATATLIHPTFSLLVRGAEMRVAEAPVVNRALRRLLDSFLSWFALCGWRKRGVAVLFGLRQSALEEELDLLICRAVLPFREFFDSRFKAGSYSDKHGNPGFVHFKTTKNVVLSGRYHSDII
jgi:hypothetical protein